MAYDHTISGLVGKLVTELEVNFNADKFYQIFKHHEEVPRAIPHIVKSMKVVEGRGMTSGCIKEWCYMYEGKAVILKECTTYNDETRTICHSVIGGDILNDYKTFNATLLVKGKFSVQRSRSEPRIWQEAPPVAYPAQPAQPAPKRHSSLCRLAHVPHRGLSKLASKTHIKPILHHLTGLDMGGHDCCQSIPTIQAPPPTIILAPPPTYQAPPPAPLFDGSCVMWIIDYEKNNEHSPVPIRFLAFLHRMLLDLNSHFCASY
ncbi:hypothetical protein MKW94_011209 [Papaver nudicaule]|uniref:Bet v I/Major latex protein domain-containing protein n=1 Tax=Papaver nudicaule TaxID=74823 RepID=A0AA41SN95_PAPNU|nr:hypothetical protein [Papaver nudicaule]